MNDDELTMTVGGVPVLSTSAESGALKLKWTDPSWESWTDLQDSAELRKLVDSANDKIAKAKAAQSKGKGKGPSEVGQAH